MSTDHPDSPPPERTATVGSGNDKWKYSSHTGFDLTRGAAAAAAGPSTTAPHLTLPTTTVPVTFPVASAALVIIDMQNFFLSPAFRRARDSPGHRALTQLTSLALPAARAANLQVIWLNWGLTRADLAAMPAGVSRAFGFMLDDGQRARKQGEVVAGDGSSGGGGPGSECGTLLLDPDTGASVQAGPLLMRGAWNSALFPPLDAWFEAGAELPLRPDVWLHKNRMSGLWGTGSELEAFLERQGIRTLLFAGVNTDQCVCGTLTDAFSKGFDCVLLSDGCGTTSPEFSRQSVEFNAAGTWGFVSTCKALKAAVDSPVVA